MGPNYKYFHFDPSRPMPLFFVNQVLCYQSNIWIFSFLVCYLAGYALLLVSFLQTVLDVKIAKDHAKTRPNHLLF